MQTLDARLHAVQYLADGVNSFELRPLQGGDWPAVTAGAHIDLRLANGLTRSYSLVNPHGETHRYVVAVQLDAGSRGGSRHMHESLRVGQKLQISAPRNLFPLHESAAHTVLIGGGIGITPLWTMAQRLSELGAPWTLHYSVRERSFAAFCDEFVALGERTGNAVHLNFDGGAPEKRIDLAQIVAKLPAEWHVYACGPGPMLQSFEAACTGREPSTVHREYFAAPVAAPTTLAEQQGFEVILAKSKRSIFVDKNVSMLDALLGAGVDMPYSCMAGVCRSCEVTVLDGVPDHQDMILTEQERAEGKTVIPCCSRAKTPSLTLDF